MKKEFGWYDGYRPVFHGKGVNDGLFNNKFGVTLCKFLYYDPSLSENRACKTFR